MLLCNCLRYTETVAVYFQFVLRYVRVSLVRLSSETLKQYGANGEKTSGTEGWC